MMDNQVTYEQFERLIKTSKSDIYLEILSENRGSIRIKKEKTIIKNLEKIFKATLKISNKKGFQAMSMRDLQQATGIGLGALYAYFTSKEELLSMLQNQHRKFGIKLVENEIERQTHPIDKLRTAIRTHLFLSEAMQS